MRKGHALSVVALVLPLFLPAAIHSQNYRVIHSFGGGIDGSPAGIALAPGGRLVGATYAGGDAMDGTLFSVDIVTGSQYLLHTFQQSDGINPSNGPTVSADGTVYGTTGLGGQFGAGTVYKLNSAGSFSVLYNFGATAIDGINPISTLAADSQGNLYGTTQIGGLNNDGTVYKLDALGNETILHNFNWSDGDIPRAGVWRDTSGNLFGTTGFGGTGINLLCGVVYKVDAKGNETVVHYFNCVTGTDGSDSWSLLTGDSAGNLYGTAAQGGQYGLGVAFKLDALGKETILHSFSGGSSDGLLPFGNLVMDSAGNLYGTAAEGGVEDVGILFKLDKAGNETILHTFTGQNGDGAFPRDLLTDAAGDIFGATTGGGAFGSGGTIFEYSPNSSTAITSMVSFVSSLFEQQVINGGQRNSLTVQLQQAAKLIASGKSKAAIGILESFIAEVDNLLASNVLTQQQASGLIAGANSLIASLS
jgi:uncharacterized repeat protein (TIGR03803 family)